ncbi:MAG: hypothetical protein ACK43M_02405 [Allorhizobium sp.]
MFLKIVLEASYYDGVTVLAALLMAIIAALTIFALTAIYVTGLARLDATSFSYRRSVFQIIAATGLTFAGGSAIYILACLLIVFGFAEDLSRDIGRWSFYRYGRANEDFITFCLIVWGPVLAHYAMVLFGSRFRTA